MLAGEEYKRIATTGSGSQCGTAGDRSLELDMAKRVLRIGSALARIPAVPVLDLADRLAQALTPLPGDGRGVMVQVGRLDGEGGWSGESVGVAGRLCELTESVALAPKRIPWPSIPTGGPSSIYLVSEPAEHQACLCTISNVFLSVGLRIDLAALACRRCPTALTLTVQVGGDLGSDAAGTASRAGLLRSILPWMHAIVQSALGEQQGMQARKWLTDRERVVLDRLVEGRSVSEIAQTLGRSKYTVHDQVKSLHRKLGVRSRAALVGCATAGVLPPDLGGGALDIR